MKYGHVDPKQWVLTEFEKKTGSPILSNTTIGTKKMKLKIVLTIEGTSPLWGDRLGFDTKYLARPPMATVVDKGFIVLKKVLKSKSIPCKRFLFIQ